MKTDLKISTFAIVSVLCTAVAASAASSVRTLGGAGTYNSASSAASANQATVKPATRVTSSAARGGSVRVNSAAAGKETTIQPGASSSNRVATTPRLSIGKYLGGGTSVSGSTSVRPQGGASSSDSMLPGSAAADAVSQLNKDVVDLQELVETKQDKLTQSANGGDYIKIATDGVISVDDVALAQKLSEKFGGSPDDFAFQIADDKIQFNFKNAGWQNIVTVPQIIAVADVYTKGEVYTQAQVDALLEAKDLSGFVTQDDLDTAAAAMDTKLSNAVELLATKKDLQDYITKADAAIASKADATALDSVGARVTSLEDAIDGVGEGSGLSDKVSALETEIATKAAQSAVDTLSAAVDANKSAAESAIAALQGKDTELAGKIDTKADTAFVSGLAQQVSALETATGADGLGAQVAALTAKDTELSGKIADNLVAIGAVADRATALETKAGELAQVDNTLDAAIKANAALIAANEMDIEQKVSDMDAAYKLADTGLDTRIQTLEAASGEGGSVAGAIADVATLKSDVSALQSRDAELAGDISDNATAISTHSTEYSALKSVVEANEADIEKKVSDMDAAYKLADTGLDTRIKSLETATGTDGQLATDISELKQQISEIVGVDGEGGELKEINDFLIEVSNTAGEAVVTAGAAKEVADSAKSAADTATDAANKAKTSADNALAVAQGAAGDAQTAVQTASDAEGIANGAADKADKAAADVATLTTTVTTVVQPQINKIEQNVTELTEKVAFKGEITGEHIQDGTLTAADLLGAGYADANGALLMIQGDKVVPVSIVTEDDIK